MSVPARALTGLLEESLYLPSTSSSTVYHRVEVYLVTYVSQNLILADSYSLAEDFGFSSFSGLRRVPSPATGAAKAKAKLPLLS
jgi:hypothetical protein